MLSQFRSRKPLRINTEKPRCEIMSDESDEEDNEIKPLKFEEFAFPAKALAADFVRLKEENAKNFDDIQKIREGVIEVNRSIDKINQNQKCIASQMKTTVLRIKRLNDEISQHIADLKDVGAPADIINQARGLIYKDDEVFTKLLAAAELCKDNDERYVPGFEQSRKTLKPRVRVGI